MLKVEVVEEGILFYFFHFGRGPTIINKGTFFTPTLDSEVMG